MGAPQQGEPCADVSERGPLPDGSRIRVVELMATGTNGGAQEHVFSLVTRLDTSRYDVSVLSLSPGSAVRKIQRAGIPVVVIDEPDDATAVGAVATYLAEERADVVHNHMYRAELVGTRAAHALELLGHHRPYVVSTIHSSRVRAPEDREQLRVLTPQMNRLIAVSQAMVRKIAAEGRRGAPVSLVYNGVDLERYDHQGACCTLRQEYGMPDRTPIVGVIARLEPEKGHETLIAAWPHVLAAFPEARLLIVGEGSRDALLRRRTEELGIADRVVFTGRREDIPAVVAALDVAVLPSYREAQGLSVLEAMALSRPVVASRVGGIPEMIEDGVTGLLVPPRAPEQLAAAIVRVLSDHQLADLLGRAGHDLVHERFCVELMVRAIESIYDEGAAPRDTAADTRAPAVAGVRGD